jgi:uncharacterized protein (TIGR02466 family)
MIVESFCQHTSCLADDVFYFDKFTVDAFDENGFFLMNNAVDKESLDQLAQKMLISFGTQAYSYVHASSCRVHCPIDIDALVDDTISRVIAPVYKTLDGFLENEKKMVELSSITVFPNAKEQVLHQDESMYDKFLVSIFVNAAPTTIESGCLWLIPGSHKKSGIEYTKAQAIPLCLPSGSALVMNSKTWHFGGANTTVDRFRTVFYFSFGDSDIQGPTYSIAKSVSDKNFLLSDFYSCEEADSGEIKTINDNNKDDVLNANGCVYTTPKNTHLHCLFPTVLLQKKLNNSDDYDKIVNKIIHKHSFDDELDYINGNQPTGEYHGRILLHHEKKLAPFFEQVKLALLEYFENLNLNTALFDFYITKCWVTKIAQDKNLPAQQSKGINAHHHSCSDASFVYYVGSNTETHFSEIHFHKNATLSYDSHFNYGEKGSSGSSCNWLNHPSYIVSPTAGDLLLFPGDLSHSVEPNTCVSERISIAGDVILVLKPEHKGMHYSRTNPSYWQVL